MLLRSNVSTHDGRRSRTARRDSAVGISILTGQKPVRSLAEYRELGGGDAFKKAVQAGASKTIEMLKRAGLRGRGGAGFPTGVKWENVAKSAASVKYVCCNGAEGEPGTFKDRYLLRTNPYLVIEGLAIARQAIGAERAYLCLKRAFEPETARVEQALTELRSATTIADGIELVLGPDEYLFGEEKALLEVIEGGLPLPRVFPPYIHGLFGGAYGGPSDQASNPTVVNNVETLAHVPHIVRRGPRWFRSFGTKETPGTMVFTVCGDVQHPVVREMPLGTSLRRLIDEAAGGLAPGRQVKAVFPGLAGSVITPELIDTPLGFDSMKDAGSALGSGGFIVYDDSACMVAAAQMFSRFLYIESCNQCPPCKIGSGRITERLNELLSGTAEGEPVDDILAATTTVEDSQRCYLPSSEALVVSSLVRAFPADFSAHTRGTCALRHDLVLPKIRDYVEGEGFTYDETYERKQPDWTYATP